MSDVDEEDSKTPLTEEGQPDSMDQTVMIPKAALGDRECKPGETLTLRVVSVDDDGVQATVQGYGQDNQSGANGYQEAGPAIDAMASQNA